MTDLTPLAPVSYDRDALVTALIYHGRSGIEGCRCGWAKLGASHPEHVADIYEESVRLRGLRVELPDRASTRPDGPDDHGVVRDQRPSEETRVKA